MNNHLIDDKRNINLRANYGKGLTFKAINGKHYSTMQELEAANNAYLQYENPMIINKDAELFQEPLSQEAFARIAAHPNYRCLIDLVEEQLRKQQSKGIKR